MLPMEGFFDGRPHWMVFSLAIVFVALVGIFDFATSDDVSLTFFYLMPIVLVTWNLGRAFGLVVVGLATVAGQVADISMSSTNGLVPSWNAVTKLALALFVVWLLSAVKEAVALQRRNAESDRRVATGLREMNDVKDTLLHAVSHDLKGPLAGIIGAMQTIRRAPELHLTDAEMQSLYEVIEGAGSRMNKLVNDMLDLERIDRGQVQPERTPTHVGRLAERVAAEAVGLEAHPVDVEADEVLVDVDRGKVERIIENLLVNAGRHTPAGTPIHVQVEARQTGIMLVIEDEGPGIPDGLKEDLFQPFRQGSTSSGRGVGIGLSLVRRFAQLHGGAAHVEDRGGGGARFVVSLPGEIQVLADDHSEIRLPQLRAV
jgi:two-component system, OmpR family, sensor histidine kinase KdpD